MIIRAVYDSSSQANYLCYLAKCITREVFPKGNLLVLPYPVANNPGLVYFPDIKLSASFWKTITACPNVHYARPFPESAVSEIQSLLIPYSPPFPSTHYQKLASKYMSYFARRLSGLPVDSVISLTILLTPYGTRGSFNIQKSPQGIRIFLTAKTDFSDSEIGRTLLMSLYKIESKTNAEIGGLDRFKRQAANDFLFRHLPGNLPVLNFRKYPHSGTYRTDSVSFLTRLGFPPENKLPAIKTDGFSCQENSLWQLLLANLGNTVSFDRVAESLWGDNSFDHFSPYTMAKVIQNLRHKIRQQGILKNIILTQRKRGYLLTP